MSKGNMFLGQAKGRVGSVVFLRRMGEQITRTYNGSPSNPKTRAQALQRAQFSTVIAASQALKEVINNSFDGVKNGQESVQEFVSKNLSDIRARSLSGDFVANEWLVPKGQSFIQPQPWILSNGNIGVLRANLSDVFGGATDTGVEDAPLFISAQQLSRSVYYRPGCQLTFVVITLKVDPQTGNYSLRPRFDRIVFNNIAPSETDSTPVIHFITGGDIYIDNSIIDLTKSTLEEYETGQSSSLPGYFSVSGEGVNARVIVNNVDENGEQVVGFGIITTYLEEDKFRHTRSILSENADSYDYTTDAVATYMNNAGARKVIDSDYYTEQPDGAQDDWDIPFLEDIVSAQISADGMRAKGIFVGQTNSYGPVAEGSYVNLEVEVPPRFEIVRNSVNAYNGENPLDNSWRIVRGAALNRVLISGPMPTTASFNFNVSFRVFDTISGTSIGTAALRTNVSKANS